MSTISLLVWLLLGLASWLDQMITKPKQALGTGGNHEDY